MFVLAASVLVCVEVMVMSSAYDVTWTVACGMSDVCKLNSMFERTPPWGASI